MNVLRTLKRMVRVFARPVEPERGLVILPYRGYGSRDEIFLMGRVSHQRTSASKNGAPTGLLAQISRRLLRRGVADADVEMRFRGATWQASTDKDGYFRFREKLDEPLPSDRRLWHPVRIEVEDDPPEEAVVAEGQIYIAPDRSRRVIISDIDDTVMYTGVANKIKAFWRLFAQDAESRVAFPGVSALYNALHDGASGNERNPLLYVSRGPWGIYEMLDAFFDAHDIPIGPILFLREWNVRLKSPLPRRAEDHKADLIRSMLSLYSEMPFVLIGDSGQHDPEIYAKIVREHPDRVTAVYIRDVSRSSSRRREIEKLASEIMEAGSSLETADDTYAMARHAAEAGLISDTSLKRVLNERIQEAEPQVGSRKGPLVVEG